MTAEHEIIEHHALPGGWEIAVWPDGRAMVLSPRTSVSELGGYSASYESIDEAIDEAKLPD